MSSIKRTARIAGALYLLIFLLSPFAFLYSPSAIVVPGDAAATAANVLASETVFRLGMVAESLVFLIEVILAAVLFKLLSPVNQTLALAASLSRFGEAVVQAVNLLTSVMALLLVGGAGYLAVFEPQQLQAMALLFLDAKESVVLVWGLFFGLHLVLTGYLVYKSGYFPRLIGALLALAGVGYFIESFGTFIAPEYAATLTTIVMFLAVPGELIFMIWLLWKGVDEEAYADRAATQLAAPAY